MFVRTGRELLERIRNPSCIHESPNLDKSTFCKKKKPKEPERKNKIRYHCGIARVGDPLLGDNSTKFCPGLRKGQGKRFLSAEL